ncbi:Hsp20/alpha crystallin family protein [Candidatus Woesearchaeota archaeon]|nr:Hsp20/alpha crystallin family protein [Candidatus Woesearchaeota archaeon]
MKGNWSIWDEMRRMQNEMDRMFSSFWNIEPGEDRPLLSGPSTGSSALQKKGYRTPLTDIWETDNKVIATLELPGMKKDDIDINVTDDQLEVNVEKKEEKEENDKEKGIYRKERRYAGFYRCFALPSNVKAEQAEASYNNGVLEVKIPKSEEPKAKAKKIEVK